MSTTATTTSDRSSLLQFNLEAPEIGDYTDRLIADSKAVQDEVAAMIDRELSFDSVVLPLSYDESVFATLSKNVIFPSYVSPDANVRAESTKSKKKISDFSIESGMRTDVYQVLKSVKQKTLLENHLPFDEQRLLDRMIRDFERNGLALDSSVQSQVKQLKEQLSQLCIEFQKNLNEDTTQLLFDEWELEGCPSDFLQSLGRSDNDDKKYIVTLKVPDVLPVMKYAKRPETRKKLDFARSSQCQSVNVPLFEQALKIRYQIARLLGFENHASYVLDVRMAKTTDNVLQFLHDLRSRLVTGAEVELNRMRELKRLNEHESEASNVDVIHPWDYVYYDRVMKETDYDLDDNLIKDYFPFDHTFNGLLQMVQETFALRFEEDVGASEDKSRVWHPDVRLYNVFDSDSNEFIGQFYLDLYPRAGKYNHFAAFPLQVHYVRADGSEQHPVSAMVCNFPKPIGDKPCLLKHSDVTTLFHEFGHLCHGFCSKAKYGRFSGTAVERDFVEMPSQFMENYCFEAEGLKRMSRHYVTGEPLSDELIQKIIAAQNSGVSLFTLRQLFFGLYDMTVHTGNGEVDSAELYAKLRKEITMIEHHAGTNPSGNFGHLMGGYDAGYYGYIYSKVFSADMFHAFLESGSVFNPDIGRRYKEKVLKVGGSRDGLDILKDFLGREPSNEAFLKSIGLL